METEGQGNRLFVVAGPGVWNSLSDDISSTPSLSVFRRKLKTSLFRQSYQRHIAAYTVEWFLEVFYLSHLNNCDVNVMMVPLEGWPINVRMCVL